MNPVTVVVGIPTYHGILAPQTSEMLSEMAQASSKFDAGVVYVARINPNTACAALSRNLLMYGGPYRKGFNPAYDYFLSVEADNALSTKAVESMVQKAQHYEDLACISAVYGSRHDRYKGKIVAGNFDPDGFPLHLDGALWFSREDKGDMVVQWCGLGAMLIPKAVIKSIPEPLFEHNRRWDSDILIEENDDVSLARKLKRFQKNIILVNEIAFHEGALPWQLCKRE